MPVSEDIIARARRLDRSAAEVLLTEVYPTVWRVAHALTGRAAAGRQVVDTVFRLSLRVMPTWGKGLMAENWFYHHTLHNARPAASNPPAISEDLLITAAPGQPSPRYVAFISALRKLPVQQREAFVLHYGERFNERLLGIAMDSSTTAARLHLSAATEALDAVTQGHATELAAHMAEAYARLSPTEKTVVPYVRTQVGRAIWRRRVRRAVRRLILLAILGALAYAGWQYRAKLQGYYEQWRASNPPATFPSATSQPK